MRRKELHKHVFMSEMGSGVMSGPACTMNLPFLFQKQVNFHPCIPESPNRVVVNLIKLDLIPGD